MTRSGKAFDLTTQRAAIARKEGETWKLVRIQATIDPVGNPIVTSIQRMKMWTIGVVTLLAGFVIGRLLPRRTVPG